MNDWKIAIQQCALEGMPSEFIGWFYDRFGEEACASEVLRELPLMNCVQWLGQARRLLGTAAYAAHEYDFENILYTWLSSAITDYKQEIAQAKATFDRQADVIHMSPSHKRSLWFDNESNWIAPWTRCCIEVKRMLTRIADSMTFPD